MFLAYFVSWSKLGTWVFGSPLAHPIGFGVVVLVTAAMMVDFAYFREQICLVACPYGRLQSVLLDRSSMIVSYDRKRGEPRGKRRSPPPHLARAAPAAAPDIRLPILAGEGVALASAGAPVIEASAAVLGDCVDCSMCVTTCPTGIDIRDGLQMECIGCAQCIDACDAVMDKVHRPRGLIRYSSQASMEGAKFRLLRPRVLLYPCVILAISALLAYVLINATAADVTVMRGLGQPFGTIPGEQVRNPVRIKILNRLDEPAEFTLSVTGVEGASLKAESLVVRVAPGEMVTVPGRSTRRWPHSGRGAAAAAILVSGPGEGRNPSCVHAARSGAGRGRHE